MIDQKTIDECAELFADTKDVKTIARILQSLVDTAYATGVTAGIETIIKLNKEMEA